MAVNITRDDQFATLLRASKKPIVLHFTAEWCGPCRMIKPALQELSDNFSSEIDFFELNVDENPISAAKHGIMSIPTLMIFQRKKMISRQVGTMSKENIAKWLQSAGVLEKEKNEFYSEEKIGITCLSGKLKLISLRRDGRYRFLDSSLTYHNIHVAHRIIDPRQARAVEEFEALLNLNNATERMFQEFFAAYPQFIINDVYSRVHSQIVLEKTQTQSLIPDFVLEPYNSNSLCDILELKRPDAKLFIDQKNRSRFSAAVFEAVAQLKEYHDYFEHEENRALVEKKYGLKFFRPKLVLIIGRRGDLTPIAFKKAQSIFPTISIETYDDLLNRMKRKYGIV
jgi:thioredoxin